MGRRHGGILRACLWRGRGVVRVFFVGGGGVVLLLLAGYLIQVARGEGAAAAT